MARRVTKRPSAGKPKLSGGTSGYGGLWSHLDPSDPKKWGLYGCKKMKIFGPKIGLGGLLGSALIGTAIIQQVNL